MRTTRVLTVDTRLGPFEPLPDAIAEAAAVLRAGGLVAFPTETVYGLGAVATDPEAVRRIFEAKGRPPTNPLIVHVHDGAMARDVVSRWPRAAARLAQRFWPGPLTLVLPRAPSIPDEVTAGLGTVGVRVPDCPVALRLLRETGRPVAAPSANRSTGVSPTTAQHVLVDLEGRIDLVLDGGPTRVGIESTVLDLSGEDPRILRPGAISASQVGGVLGQEIDPGTSMHSDDRPAMSPGQMELHYAPRARVVVCEPGQVETSGPRSYPPGRALLVAGQQVGPTGDQYDDRVDWHDPETAARELYATLRRWDDQQVQRIDAVFPPDLDAWRAVRDRLWRASRRWARE